jgi:hypothetical protein
MEELLDFSTKSFGEGKAIDDTDTVSMGVEFSVSFERAFN